MDKVYILKDLPTWSINLSSFSTTDFAGKVLSRITERIAQQIIEYFGYSYARSLTIRIINYTNDSVLYAPRCIPLNNSRFKVLVNIQPATLYCMYIYQVSHELWHCLMHAQPRNNDNGYSWIAEVLCETGSMIILDIMASIWNKDAFLKELPGVKKDANTESEMTASYAGAVKKYLDEHLGQIAREKDIKTYFQDNVEWFHDDENASIKSQRPRNNKVAIELYAYIKFNPHGLSASRHLATTFIDVPHNNHLYFTCWLNECETVREREFVSFFGKSLGIFN